MNDFECVPVIEARRTVKVARQDLAIELDDNACRTNLELFEQCVDREALRKFAGFTIQMDFHVSDQSGLVPRWHVIEIKNRVHADHLLWPGNTV